MLNQTMKDALLNGVVKETEAEAWNCSCGALLGLFQYDEAFDDLCLFIKHKDLYLVVRGGPDSILRRLCTKCGKSWVLSGKNQPEEGGEKE